MDEITERLKLMKKVEADLGKVLSQYDLFDRLLFTATYFTKPWMDDDDIAEITYHFAEIHGIILNASEKKDGD